MDKKQWNYIIRGRKMPVILIAILLALFGGLTFWLYRTGNGAYLFTGLFSGILLILWGATIYRRLFFRISIGRDGFSYQTHPKNETFYPYTAVKKAWIHSGETQNTFVESYCNIDIPGMPVLRFQFFPADAKAVRYLLKRVEATAQPKDEPTEYLIDGKVFGKTKIVIGIVLFLVITFVTVCVIKLSGHILLAIPGIAMAVGIFLLLCNRNLYYKIKIGATGFDYRTNPFNGKHFEYREIVACRTIKKVVYHRYHVGDADVPSYFFFFEFTDLHGTTRKFQYENPIHGHEIDVLKKRIEKNTIR